MGKAFQEQARVPDFAPEQGGPLGDEYGDELRGDWRAKEEWKVQVGRQGGLTPDLSERTR